MVDKVFLKDQMIRLETNYGKDRFKITKQMFELWYEMFSDYDPEGIKASVSEYIRTNEFPPTVASINNIYERKKEYRERMNTLISDKYRWVAMWFNESFDKETRKVLADYTMSFPKDKREKALSDIAHDAVAYWNECNEKGILEKDRKSFKEFIEERR